MPFRFLFLLFCFSVLRLNAQDSLYTRSLLRFLCSDVCYGRGYLKGGLRVAEEFIVKELQKSKTLPLFEGKYTQSFYHSVNTFPKVCELSINNTKLKAGKNFIPNAASCSSKGTYSLSQVDSVTFVNNNVQPPLQIVLKNKLTFTVSKQVGKNCVIEVDQTLFKEKPSTLKVNIKNKLVTEFESRNIACSIKGTDKADSLIVFSAHYDHLGGLGKNTYFPGANDNASGVSMLLNLVKYYSAHPIKYTVVFIFFAGEEAGLLGSRFFVENSAIDLKKIKFLLNLDLLGTGEEGIMVVNGSVHEREFILLSQLSTDQQYLPAVKKRGKAANSDHYWFTEAGVPSFFIYTLGGIKAYHDVYDIEKTLPLTAYKGVFNLLRDFVAHLY